MPVGGDMPRPAVRPCGPCHLCCRVFAIPEANKPHTDWCDELIGGIGCSSYLQRPAPCRDFFCLWTRDERLGEDWRPDISGFVLSDPAPWAFLATQDPDRHDAWRRAPYRDALHAWARQAERQGQFAGVREGRRLILLSGGHEIVIEDGGEASP